MDMNIKYRGPRKQIHSINMGTSLIVTGKLRKVSKSSLLEHFDVIAEKIYKEIGWAQ